MAPARLDETGKWVCPQPAAPPLLPPDFGTRPPVHRFLPALLSLGDPSPTADLSPRLLLTCPHPFDVESFVLQLWGFLGSLFL